MKLADRGRIHKMVSLSFPNSFLFKKSITNPEMHLRKHGAILLLILCLGSCQSTPLQHDALLSFELKHKNVEELYYKKGFREADYIGVVKQVAVQQVVDTLLVDFEILEGGVAKMRGNIAIEQDTLFLQSFIERGVRAINFHHYQYKIFNPSKREYIIKLVEANSVYEIYRPAIKE